MRSLQSWLRWSRGRAAAMLAGRRLFVLAAALLAVVGAAWLLLSSSDPMVPLADRAFSSADASDAQLALGARGIECRVEDGQVLVPRSRLAEAQAALRAIGAEGDAELQRLAKEEDVWSSQSQLARRWQAAKMATLARLIRRFPAVQSATVVYEEGRPASLGAPGAEPTASVGVELKSGCAMTPDLVEAIADLVAGGVAGLKRSAVRVVDSTGRSYRAEEPFAGESPALRQLHAAEAYYARKVRGALPAIEGAIVAVRAELRQATIAQVAGETPSPRAGGAPPGDLPRCAEVRVSIPRGYFVAVARAAGGQGPGGRPRPDEAAVSAAIAAGLDQMRNMVAAVLDSRDATRIQMDWHYDAASLAEECPPAVAQAETSWIGRLAAAGAGAAGAVVVLLAAWLVFRSRPEAVGDAGALAARAGGAGAPGALGSLQWAGVDELVALARAEHPQTVAVLLSALPAERAGAVMAALAPEMQREVARRIVALERIEPQMLREVDRALAGRLKDRAPRPGAPDPAPGGPREGEPVALAGGVARLADLLHRAGPATRGRVLDALAQELPGLAESIQRRGLAFEDIAALGDSRLRAVLEAADSRRLAIALRTASKPLAQKVYSVLSAPAARRLRAQVQNLGPVRLSDVEAAQQQIVEELLAGEPGRYAPAGADQVA